MKQFPVKVDWLLIFIVGIVFAIYILQLTSDQGWHDFALYAMQTKAILHNHVDTLFAMNKYSVENSSAPNGPYLYPWGFPLLLSPVMYFFGFNLYAFKVYMVLFFGASLVGVFILFKNRLGRKLTFIAVCLFGFNPVFVLHTNNVLSDIPFLFFSLITLYFMQKVVIEGVPQFGSKTDFIILGILMFICYAIRSNGIVFIPVLFLCQGFVAFRKHRISNRKFRLNDLSYFLFLPYMIFVLLNISLNQLLPEGSSSHFDLLSKVSPESLFSNLIYYLKLPSHFFYLDSLKILYYLTLPFTLLGVIKNWRQDILFILFILFSAAVLVVWPYTQGMRFIFPILPFYLYFTILGLLNMQQALIKRGVSMKLKLPEVFAALLISIFLFIQARTLAKGEKITLPGPYDIESQEMFHFISSNLHEHDTIIFRKPRSMMLFTENFSLRENRPDRISKFESGYLVLDKTEADHQINLSDTTQLSLKLIFSNDRFLIYSISEP